ncbi:glycoside hydrolase family 32 protein [Luteimicrobium xylanilyticum]|uniref:beta-fructofuranosidase n=1 Tax=Luteimicrobium xylanilyticum TaxID=1133546 RepID=A0A5P9Q8Q5_9MICO|nr:glycoside hydrolase family 32 protein [Luteimicrobium xylanilyticum]QFU97666.1 Beta-fructofuranosidase [Luteimicrobium xylanilyticum]
MTETATTRITERPASVRADTDPHRPRFHFVPPSGWLNDPNGLTQRDGVYHLFYQHNPEAAVHHRISWGHATSRDLVHWQDEPVALVPGDSGPDVDGCWSGVLVDDGGVPTIVYSGRHGERELPCVATGSDDLRAWTKDPRNPVVAAPPAGLDLVAFRDHSVWREGGRWRQLIGSGIRGRGGTALLYESVDLRSWDYVGPLLVGTGATDDRSRPDWTGTMWECVELFGLQGGSGARDVLVFSAWDEGQTHHALYFTGEYVGDTFVPDGTHRLDLGGRYFYAPQSFTDDAGRRVMFGWLQEGRPDAAAVAAGWSGVMSLPRVVTLAEDGGLRLAPAPEIADLRRDRVTLTGREMLAGEPAALASGDQLDVELLIALEPGASARLVLRATPDASEETVLEIARETRGRGDARVRIRLDRSRSSLDPAADRGELTGDAPARADGLVHLRLLVDRSALELFVNGQALTARVYPTRADAVAVRLAATGGRVRIEDGAAWRMEDAWQAGAPDEGASR